MIRDPQVDVVTVGAGLTASMLAAKLCTDGYQVRSLEQGASRWTYPEFAHDHDSLRYSVRYAMMVDLARESWTWRPDARSPALPMRQYGSFNPGEGLGGSMVHWSAQLWRYMENDFRNRSHIVERYGASKLPAGSSDPRLADHLQRPRALVRRVRGRSRRLRPGRQRQRQDPARAGTRSRRPDRART